MSKPICVILILTLTMASFAQTEEILMDDGWKAKRALEVPVDGTVVSSPEFELYDWMEAVVPGTVLTTLLHNKKVPDPFYGLNNELIPDIYETGAEYYTFWFRKNFVLPELKEGEQLGEISGIEDFCKKAQLVNYEQYRALQEGFNAGMWDKYTGMLVWKNQNPWTSLRGQFYDVYLEQDLSASELQLEVAPWNGKTVTLGL